MNDERDRLRKRKRKPPQMSSRFGNPLTRALDTAGAVGGGYGFDRRAMRKAAADIRADADRQARERRAEEYRREQDRRREVREGRITGRTATRRVGPGDQRGRGR